MANLYSSNEDLRFYAERAIDWKEVSGGKLAAEDARGMLEVTGDIADSLRQDAEKIDRKGTHLYQGRTWVPREMMDGYRKLAEAGLTALSSPEDIGGLGMPITLNALSADLIASASITPLLSAFLNCSAALYKNCRPENRTPELDEIVRKTIAGEYLGAMVITEPQSGSDAFRGLRTEAYQKDGKWYVRGNKQFITSGCAETHVIIARSDPRKHGTNQGLGIFLVYDPVERSEVHVESPIETKPGHVMPAGDYVAFKHTPAIDIIGVEDKLGIKGSPTCALAYNDAPAWHIGQDGAGDKEMLKLFDGARLVIAVQGVGVAQEAYDDALAYARERKQFADLFDGPIANIPAVRKDLLGELEHAWRAGRTLIYDAARAVDLTDRETDERRRKDADLLSLGLTCLAKYWCSERAIEGTIRGLQTFGGYGYTKDYPAERHLRDSIIASQYEGTSQIQQAFLMKKLGHLLPLMYREMEGNLRQARKDKSLQGLVHDADHMVREVYGAAARFKMMADDVKAGTLKPPMFEEAGCQCNGDHKLHTGKALAHLASYYGKNVIESLAETYITTALLRQAPLRESKAFKEYVAGFTDTVAMRDVNNNARILRKASNGIVRGVKESLGWKFNVGLK